MGQNRATDGEDLGRILEDRLSRIIPAGFHVGYCDDGVLWYSSDPARFPGQTGGYQVGQTGVLICENFDPSVQSVEERVFTICIHALDDLEDYIDEATHDP